MERTILRLFQSAMVAACLAAGAAPAWAQNGAPPPAARAALSPGDVVRITVWRQPELSGEFVVAVDGTLAHPIYREIPVAGLSMDRVEDAVRGVLSRYEAEPRFSLEPLVRVAVEGEVRQPSLYTVPVATSVAQAVAMAGGATERGRLDDVRVFRAGEIVAVDLTDPRVGVAESTVRSGDRIVVSRRTLVFRDYIAPIASLAGAAAAIATLIIRIQEP